MKITMIGTGYVGLVSGVCFAEIGHHVTCVDINHDIVKLLNDGKCHIYEPGLNDLLNRNLKAKRVTFSADYTSVSSSEIIFLAVQTPASVDGSADLSYISEAAKSVAQNLCDHAIVVIKSTVPPGSHKLIEDIIKKNTDKQFYLVNNPEFLKEGAAIDDLMRPDRVIIGCQEDHPKKAMEEFYAPLVRQGNPIYCMSNLSAEMTKYASNCMLATKISFINEIAKLCDATGADIEEVRKGMASDKRIGPHFIFPGPGFGGSCFPKDVKAMRFLGKECGVEMSLITAADEANNKQKTYMFEKIKEFFKGDLKDRTFAFWGVTFKPGTDDVRGAPAISMAESLLKEGAKIQYYDPEGSDNFASTLDSMEVATESICSFTSKYDCLNGAQGLIVMTEWPEFRAPDFGEIKLRLKSLNIFDARNVFNTNKILDEGFKYFAIGKRIL